MTIRRHRMFFALAAVLMILSATPAGALDLQEAKSSGLVGERPDGLVAVVGNAGGEAAALVSRVNAARIAKYGDIASRNGTSAQAVQIIFGKELIAKAPPGSRVMSEKGEWHTK